MKKRIAAFLLAAAMLMLAACGNGRNACEILISAKTVFEKPNGRPAFRQCAYFHNKTMRPASPKKQGSGSNIKPTLPVTIC